MSEIRATLYRQATGLVAGLLTCPADTAMANVSAEIGVWLGDHLDPATEYITVEAPVLARAARPVVPAPSSPQAVGWSYGFEGLPAGTVLTVYDEFGDGLEVASFAEPLTLTDRGLYRMVADPPAPWLGFDIEVDVA